MKIHKIGRKSATTSLRSRGLVSLTEREIQDVAGGDACLRYDPGDTPFGPTYEDIGVPDPHAGYVHTDGGVSPGASSIPMK